MAVDEQDGPDLTWVEVSSDQNLYQCAFLKRLSHQRA